MKRCPKCGTANREYAATCLKCGYDFNNESVPTYHSTAKPTSTHKSFNNQYQQCQTCKRYFPANADKCPYCGADSDNRYTDNYCVRCGRHVTRFNLLHRQSPDSQGDMTYFVCPYCHSKQGWHCPTCHRYNDIKQPKGKRPEWSKNYNTNGLLCNHCYRLINNYCPKCNIPVSPSYNYCPHCGFNLRHTAGNESTSSLFFTRHPYSLDIITIIFGWVEIISNLNIDAYPAKYVNAVISGSMLITMGLLLVTTVTRHLCPMTVDFITLGIGYFVLRLTGLGVNGDIAWEITDYFGFPFLFIIGFRVLVIMDSIIVYSDMGYLRDFIRYLH